MCGVVQNPKPACVAGDEFPWRGGTSIRGTHGSATVQGGGVCQGSPLQLVEVGTQHGLVSLPICCYSIKAACVWGHGAHQEIARSLPSPCLCIWPLKLQLLGVEEFGERGTSTFTCCHLDCMCAAGVAPHSFCLLLQSQMLVDLLHSERCVCVTHSAPSTTRDLYQQYEAVLRTFVDPIHMVGLPSAPLAGSSPTCGSDIPLYVFGPKFFFSFGCLI